MIVQNSLRHHNITKYDIVICYIVLEYIIVYYNEMYRKLERKSNDIIRKSMA